MDVDVKFKMWTWTYWREMVKLDETACQIQFHGSAWYKCIYMSAPLREPQWYQYLYAPLVWLAIWVQAYICPCCLCSRASGDWELPSPMCVCVCVCEGPFVVEVYTFILVPNVATRLSRSTILWAQPAEAAYPPPHMRFKIKTLSKLHSGSWYPHPM